MKRTKTTDGEELLMPEVRVIPLITREVPVAGKMGIGRQSEDAEHWELVMDVVFDARALRLMAKRRICVIAGLHDDVDGYAVRLNGRQGRISLVSKDPELIYDVIAAVDPSTGEKLHMKWREAVDQGRPPEEEAVAFLQGFE